MDIGKLPSIEEFEKLDKISRRDWRFACLKVFIVDFGADLIREMLAAGPHEWRLQTRAFAAKHSLKQEDMDWIFQGLGEEIARRDRLIGTVRELSLN